jgi:hypothetical protein
VHRYAHKEGSRARELLGTPVGQIVGRLNEVRSTRDVIFGMVEELDGVLARLAALTEE